MKYCPGVPTLAPSGLRTHICQVPSKAATRKAANDTQKCARQSRSTLRTGDPPVPIRFEFIVRHDLNRGPHLAVAGAAILMTVHEQISGTRECGVHLGDKAGHDHGVHIGPGDQQTVNDVGRREAERDGAPARNRDAMRNEHELRGDGPHRDAAVRSDRGSQVLLGELAREMQYLGVDPLHVAGRIYALGQGGEYDHPEDRGDEHADAECPQHLGAANSPLVDFAALLGHALTHRAAREEEEQIDHQITDYEQSDGSSGQDACAQRHDTHRLGQRRLIDVVGDFWWNGGGGGFVVRDHRLAPWQLMSAIPYPTTKTGQGQCRKPCRPKTNRHNIAAVPHRRGGGPHPPWGYKNLSTTNQHPPIPPRSRAAPEWSTRATRSRRVPLSPARPPYARDPTRRPRSRRSRGTTAADVSSSHRCPVPPACRAPRAAGSIRSP